MWRSVPAVLIARSAFLLITITAMLLLWRSDGDFEIYSPGRWHLSIEARFLLPALITAEWITLTLTALIWFKLKAK